VRRLYLKRWWVLLLGLLAAGPAGGGDGVSPARDLAADAAAARAHGAPILVFFTAADCPYCHEVASLYLEPMQRRGDYAGRLLIRSVDVDSSAMLIDFDGRGTRHEEFAQRAGTRFTPTIRIYSPDGAELANALVGYTSRDFFGGMLWEAIDESIARLRSAHAGRLADAAADRGG
jgi:thiol-disulfide isomerase/thioredoxin